VKLSDMMNRFPQTITAGDSLYRARDLMAWGGYRHLPVVEPESNKVIGILSQSDIAQHQATTGQSLDASTADTVAMAMTASPETANPDDSLTEAAARMASHKIGCLPITERGKLVGLVTTTDVLAAEVREAMRPMRDGPSVGDFMTRNVHFAHSNDRLLDAAAKMQQKHVRHLPVVDVKGRVVGILSDRDVRAALGDPSRVLEKTWSLQAELLHVKDAMSTPAITTTPDQSCVAAAGHFVGLSASAVPVVDADNNLLGILSYLDLLRAFAGQAV
jgi:CBS domain-containing protein